MQRKNSESVDDDASEETKPKKDEGKVQVFRPSKINPVFYEDKASRKLKRDDATSKRKMAKTDYIETLRKEIYEEPEEVHLGGMTNKKSAFMRQMDTMESLE